MGSLFSSTAEPTHDILQVPKSSPHRRESSSRSCILKLSPESGRAGGSTILPEPETPPGQEEAGSTPHLMSGYLPRPDQASPLRSDNPSQSFFFSIFIERSFPYRTIHPCKLCNLVTSRLFRVVQSSPQSILEYFLTPQRKPHTR